MASGRVKAYRPRRGFGFITPENEGGDVFVQVDDVEGGHERHLVPGQPVEYEATVGTDGQLKAVGVRPLR